MSWANPANWTPEAIARRADLRRERNRRYRRSHPASHKQRTLPFVAVDGEGWGTDRDGRQNLMLLRCGGRELYFGEPLHTVDCLEFLLAAPRDALLAGFYFTYDATMILRDLPQYLIERILNPPPREAGASPYTWYKREYGIDWRPKQYFRVARINPETRRVIPNTARTVNEVSGFFRHSFVEVISDWKAATPAQIERIANGKEHRGDIPDDIAAVRRYCKLECNALETVMERFREHCRVAGIVPQAWRGAGQMSAVLHKAHGTPKAKELPPRVKPFSEMAEAAYYGGRFELPQVGRIDGTIYEYDLNSTYAAVLPRLPCPLHTKWKRLHFDQLRRLLTDDGGTHYVADITFNHDERASALCHLPIRRVGRLSWPRRGRGTYWGAELGPACRAGTIVHEFHGGYVATQKCECRHFSWVDSLYAERLRLGADGEGYPIKLALAALYGKLCQREGAAPWRDIVAAGLVTAIVRGMLIDGYAADPGAVVMLASDAIYSTRPLALDIGTGLGQWELIERNGIFTIQPGLYWSDPAAPKTRGIPRSRIIERAAEFESLWADWIAADLLLATPALTISLEQFIGFRLALERNDFHAAGRWETQKHRVSFAWGSKRAKLGRVVDSHVETLPISGSFGMKSEPYDPSELTEFQRRQIAEEAAPDFEPWGNSGE